MRIFSYRRKKIFFCALVLIFLIKICVHYLDIDNLNFFPKKTQCDLNVAKRTIENLCQYYNNEEKNNLVTGNMCKSLCNTVNKFNYYQNYKLSNCYNQKKTENFLNQNNIEDKYDAYKVVLIYERLYTNDVLNKPKKMVLKSRHKHFLDFDTHLDFDFEDKPMIYQLKFLVEHIKFTLETQFGIEISKDVLLWIKSLEQNTENINDIKRNLNKKDIFYYLNLFAVDHEDFKIALKNNNTRLMARFINNLIILMMQDEYLFYRFFQLKPGTLKIYGTCGHMYMTEYAESLAHKTRSMSLDEKKSLAIKFLDLVHNLDTVYLIDEVKKKGKMTTSISSINEINNKLTSIPIHMCDIKLDNFGLSFDGELKIIDTDMLHTESYLFGERICKDHEDCHYFDCKSYCEPLSKKCIRKRINNNLQAFCENILDNHISKNDAIITSAYFGSNVDGELKRQLNLCINPGFYLNSNVVLPANQSLIKILNTLLKDQRKYV